MTDPAHRSPETTDLLRGATDDLAPDVERLVAGGIARGRTLRRRRTTMTTLAAAAVVGVIGVAAGVGSHALAGDDDRRTDSAIASPGVPDAGVIPDSPRRALVVDQVDVPDTFGRLFPEGEVREVEQYERMDDAPVVDFFWDDYAVRVSVTPMEYVDGTGAPAEQRCFEAGLDCTELPTGVWVASGVISGETPEVLFNEAHAFTPDGWDLMVRVGNAQNKEGVPLADEPPISQDQLIDVVTSDVWFSATEVEPPYASPEPPDVTDVPDTNPDDIPVDALVTVRAEAIPGVVAGLLPAHEVGGLVEDESYQTVDERQEKRAFFEVDGTLAHVQVEREDSLASCEAMAGQSPELSCTEVDGVRLGIFEPSGDLVDYRSVSAYVHGFIVTVDSYNPVGSGLAQPPLSIDELTTVATSEVWFTE